jgi:hypothetical protein
MRAMPHGQFCVGNCDELGRWLPGAFAANTLLYTWGHIAARCIGRGEVAYKVAAMYLEFENNAGAVAAPAFSPADGIDYYNNLATSPDRDYIRAALDTTPQIVVAPGYEAYLAPDLGNRVDFAAQTSATAGVHGKPFSAAASSKVFGVALVATPAFQDPTADILLARGYYDPSLQIPKVSSTMRALYRILFGEGLG